MKYLQKLYMAVLNPIYGITGKVNEKWRNAIIFVCLSLMTSQMFFFTVYQKYSIPFGYAELFVINTFLLAIIIVFSVKKELQCIKWTPWIYVSWMLFAIVIIITGVHHSITGALMFFAGLILIVFPCLYFVWNNRGDYHTIYRLESKAILLFLVIYFIACLMTTPFIESTAYNGISINPNSNGFLGVAGTIAALYLIISEKKKRIIYVIICSMAISLIIFSSSRASMVAVILIFICFIICYYKMMRCSGDRAKGTIILILAIVACSIISVIGYRFILIDVTPYLSSHLKSDFNIEEESDNGVAVDDSSNKGNAVAEKFSGKSNINDMTSGRIVIWKDYIGELNLVGNQRGEKGLYIAEKWGYYSAHNSYLEIGYRCGIFAGLLYAYIAIYAAVYSFRFLFGSKLFDYRLSLIPMAVMAFGVLSNLERALYPVEKVHIFLFFIALAPMFMKQTNKTENIIENDEKKLS